MDLAVYNEDNVRFLMKFGIINGKEQILDSWVRLGEKSLRRYSMLVEIIEYIQRMASDMIRMDDCITVMRGGKLDDYTFKEKIEPVTDGQSFIDLYKQARANLYEKLGKKPTDNLFD